MTPLTPPAPITRLPPASPTSISSPDPSPDNLVSGFKRRSRYERTWRWFDVCGRRRDGTGGRREAGSALCEVLGAGRDGGGRQWITIGKVCTKYALSRRILRRVHERVLRPNCPGSSAINAWVAGAWSEVETLLQGRQDREF